MRTGLSLMTLLAVLIATGCAAGPSVTYQVADGPDIDGRLKFVLARSLIVLDRKASKDDGLKLVATSVPTDLPIDGKKRLYAIVPTEQIGVHTRLKITYADNSRIMASVGVEVEDNRVKTIGEIAGAIVAGAALAAALSVTAQIPDRLPLVIDPKGYEKGATRESRWLPLPHNSDWVYRLDAEAPPADAVEAVNFFNGSERTVLPYSACRDATLYLLQTKASKKDHDLDKRIYEAWVFGLKLADPDKVLTIAFPNKGKIDMHTACGANITSEKTDTGSVWALVGETIKQATAIKKAYDAVGKQAPKKEGK